MITTQTINKNIDLKLFNGIKIPHENSLPVIHKEDDKYYLAVFTFYFTPEDIYFGCLERPVSWALLDINTGSIIEKFDTDKKEFSDASYSKKYDIKSEEDIRMNIEEINRLFTLLDECRNEIISTGNLSKIKYNEYLESLVKHIPKQYKRFYYDLSI